MRCPLLLVIAVLLAQCTQRPAQVHQPIAIVPKPVAMQVGASSFRLDKRTVIVHNGCASEAALHLREQLERAGLHLRLEEVQGFEQGDLAWQDAVNPGNRPTRIFLDCEYPEFLPDADSIGYKLRVDGKKIYLASERATGLYRGMQSIFQLLPPSFHESKQHSHFHLPSVSIIDYPRFTHRGMLLDVCRHFFSTQVVKDYIDLLAFYKMNTLHLHLTEDQGWRIAIDAYPELSTIGAWRTGPDGSLYGGFYSKSDIREIVDYAHSRHVRIIPEIEMPGHAQAALASYPHLGCTGGPYEVANDWGVFREIYCAGNDTVFEFLEAVLDEVMELFPSRYIHIGGDEAPKYRWEHCPKCQKRMRDEGLKDEHELQSWFIGKIANYLQAHGRTMIGWDEILEGGLTPHAVVQSWRGSDGAVAAARAGQYAVMSPTSHSYFDYSLKQIDLHKVYSFNPVPAAIGEEGKASYILGAECNLWTEHIPDRATLDRQAFPRMLAMAEVLWSQDGQRDFADFRDRLQYHYPTLRAKGVNYGAEQWPYTAGTLLNGDSLFLVLDAQQQGIALSVTALPEGGTALYSQALHLDAGTAHELRVQPMLKGHPVGSADHYSLRAHKALGAKVYYRYPFSTYYTGGGHGALLDGMLGSTDFRDGRWQGFAGHDVEVLIDMGEPKSLERLSVQAHQYSNAWIFLPTEVLCYGGMDSTKLQLFTSVKPNASPGQRGQFNESFDLNFAPVEVRYVKLIARSRGKVPDWHEAAGSEAWTFIDEIVLE